MVKKCYLEGIFDIPEKGQKKAAIWQRILKSEKEGNAIGRQNLISSIMFCNPEKRIDIKIRNMEDLRGFGVLPDKI